jgi:predicted ATPase
MNQQLLQQEDQITPRSALRHRPIHPRTAWMKRYILTGTPGSGKTCILHQLNSQGSSVVEEAATLFLRRKGGHQASSLSPKRWMNLCFRS